VRLPSSPSFDTPGSRSRLLLGALVVVVLVILVEGAVRQRRPVSPIAVTAPAVAPREAPPALGMDLDKTPLSYFSEFWPQLGNRTRQRIVLVGTPKAPALVMTPSLALTSLGIARESILSLPDGTARRLVAADSETGLALIEITSPATAFQASDPATLHAGQLVAAVSLSPDGGLLVAPGHITGLRAAPGAAADSLDVAVTPSRLARLSALVDLDGRLVGACYDRRGRSRVLSAPALFRLAERLQTSPFCHAIDVGDVTSSVRNALGVKGGVVVERILQDAWAAPPSIQPGDVVLEWNGEEVSDRALFERAYEATQAGSLATYVALRGRLAIRGSLVMPDAGCLTPPDDPISLPKVGLSVARQIDPDSRAGPPAWRVVAVTPGGAAARAGLTPGDSIVTLDGRAVEGPTGASAFQVLDRSTAPALLTVRRGDRALVLALERGSKETDGRRR
jgi:S1-C subfamily serine protease